MSKICCRKRVLYGLILVALLVACCSSLSTAWAQAKPTTAPTAQNKTEPGLAVMATPQLPKGPMDLDAYAAQGYSVHGPAKLQSASRMSLVFPGENDQKGLEIVLAKKIVTVMDAAGNARSLSALGPGTTVIVCHKADKVVIFIVPQKVRSGNAAQ